MRLQGRSDECWGDCNLIVARRSWIERQISPQKRGTFFLNPQSIRCEVMKVPSLEGI